MGGRTPLVPVSTVGAGDATLAGWLSAQGAPAPERLRTAVAWGRAAVRSPAPRCPGPNTSTARPCAWSPTRILVSR